MSILMSGLSIEEVALCSDDFPWRSMWSVCCVCGQHQPANIIGLKMLKRLGLHLFEDEPHFAFSATFKYFSSRIIE